MFQYLKEYLNYEEDIDELKTIVFILFSYRRITINVK
jgi:hypothetical protein